MFSILMFNVFSFNSEEFTGETRKSQFNLNLLQILIVLLRMMFEDFLYKCRARFSFVHLVVFRKELYNLVRAIFDKSV